MSTDVPGRGMMPPGAGGPQPGQTPMPPAAPNPSTVGSQDPAEAAQVLRLRAGEAPGNLVRCARCGSSDIRYGIEQGALICASCRAQWNEPLLEAEVDLTRDIDKLRGRTITTSAQRLVDETTVTLKCRACGAEVVLSVDDAVQTRCHWCRNYLSADGRIPNGAVPDGVIPPTIRREDAVETIRAFAKDRSFYAHPKFKAEFAPENVVGVYLPYFVFDGHAEAEVQGEGEIQTATWLEGSKDNKTRYYAADVYRLGRKFLMSVDDLLLESSSEHANLDDPAQTNNIINAILPFDVKRAVHYNPNYLRGFTSERRDVNVEAMDAVVEDRLLSIARSKADDMVQDYDRGVRWDSERVDIRGSRWVTVYLPIWLYSYYQADKGLKHFVAVNGQNGKVMGSIPLNMLRLSLMTALVFVVASVVGVALFLLWR